MNIKDIYKTIYSSWMTYVYNNAIIFVKIDNDYAYWKLDFFLDEFSYGILILLAEIKINCYNGNSFIGFAEFKLLNLKNSALYTINMWLSFSCHMDKRLFHVNEIV